MSSDRPSDAPSPPSEGRGAAPAPEDPGADEALAELVRGRGATLVEALERHQPGAREHAEATGSYAFVAAVAAGCGRPRAELIREVAKLHEVGRLYLPPALLATPVAALDEQARARLAAHHEAGATLARGAGLPEQACEWILRSRERFDGRGPEGLAGEAIPAEARVIRAACRCATLLSDAPGSGSDFRRRAIGGLLSEAGTELDPEVVEALVATLRRAGD